MKKSYLLLCLMALTSSLLICNSVLADEYNSEVDGWEDLGKTAISGATEAAVAERENQGFEYHEKIETGGDEAKETGSKMTDHKSPMDVTEKSRSSGLI